MLFTALTLPKIKHYYFSPFLGNHLISIHLSTSYLAILLSVLGTSGKVWIHPYPWIQTFKIHSSLCT